jgi:hypothetical protein
MTDIPADNELGGAGKGGTAPGPAAPPGAPIDPTKNVLDLVRAESKYQDYAREAESKYQDGMRDAEMRRQDGLAEQRRWYDKATSDILTVQVKTTSELISTQLEKVTTNLSNQIEAMRSNLTERLSQLERFRWEVGGKTSVSDPATADALLKMAAAINQLNSQQARGDGSKSGVSAQTTTLIAVAGLVVVVIGLGLSFMNRVAPIEVPATVSVVPANPRRE